VTDPDGHGGAVPPGPDDGDAAPAEPTPGPLAALRPLAAGEVAVTDELDHLELYTMGGLLTLLWHGRADLADVVVMCGGAMGGLLGPARGAYHQLGVEWTSADIGTIRVGYRQPGDLDACVHDVLAAAEMSARRGARRFVVVGHSFGGAVAVRAGVALGADAAGVVTLATQAPGCEQGDELVCPALHVHGDADTILPAMSSQAVQMLTDGELVILPGVGHLLDEAADDVVARLREWIPTRFAEHRERTGG
jgi:hypothetical protein